MNFFILLVIAPIFQNSQLSFALSYDWNTGVAGMVTRCFESTHV